MRSTIPLGDQYGTSSGGHGLVQPWRRRVPYETFKSRFGPQTKAARFKLGQYDLSFGRRILPMVGGFGVAAGTFALFFFNGIPRIKKDIFQHVPIIGSYFVTEVAPEDNPF